MPRIYFDNAATTPLLPEVIEAITESLRDSFGNPNSIHAEGRKARTLVEKSRQVIARTLNASLSEVFFTSGGTESNNTVLFGAVRDLGVTRIITNATEHHSILHTLEQLQDQNKVEVVFLQNDAYGRPSMVDLDHKLSSSDSRTLVSLMHSNNETGTMIDLAAVGQLCEAHNAFFHSDTVQTFGYFPIDVQAVGIHFLSGSAHKLHGPKGTGILYMNAAAIIKPLIYGGAQERNLRAGTENVAGIVGLSKAVELANSNRESRMNHLSNLRDRMVHGLMDIPIVTINTDLVFSHPKVLSVSITDPVKADLLAMNLDISGVAVSGGSACSSGIEHQSHVMQTLGVDPTHTTIRFSFSHLNTMDEVDSVLSMLQDALQ